MHDRLSFSLALLAAAATPLHARATSSADLVITGAVSRATPAGAPTGVGYLTVTNDADAADRLVSATCPAVDHVEIHEMTVRDGVMTMHPVPGGLVVPAHGSLTLKPGGYHLMMIGPKKPFKPGDTLPVTLTFERAGTRQVDLSVKSMGEVLPPIGK